MKQILKYMLPAAGCLVLGYVLGALSVSAMRDPMLEVLMKMQMLDYRLEQKQRAYDAETRGEWDEAACHYRNMLELSQKPGLECFKAAHYSMPLTWPFAIAVLHRMRLDEEEEEKVRQIEEADAHHRLADALMHEGLVEKAREHYTEACRFWYSLCPKGVSAKGNAEKCIEKHIKHAQVPAPGQ